MTEPFNPPPSDPQTEHDPPRAGGVGGAVTVGMAPDATLLTDASTAPGQTAEQQTSLTKEAWRDLRRNPLFIVAAAVVTLMILVAAFPRLFAGEEPGGATCPLGQSRLPPRAGHIFGNDLQGCDVYAKVIYGARPSIVIGIVVTIVTLFIGIVLGSISGFYGGWVDTILSRFTDVAFGFPFIVGAIVILTAFPQRSVWTVVIVLSALGWAGLVRIMRSSVFSAKSMDYVQAARALGATNSRIIIRHILPNAVTPVIVLATIGVGAIIGSEATLTFLGVGLQAPANSWGLSISQAQRYFIDSPHMLLFPALFLSTTVLAFIVLGDAVRDAFDPKLR